MALQPRSILESDSFDLWCPWSNGAPRNINALSGPNACIGSKCMAWIKDLSDATYGYCGMAKADSAPPSEGTPPGTPVTITIDPVPAQVTSPVTISGTVSPGAVVTVWINLNGSMVGNAYATIDATATGTFSTEFALAPSTGYSTVVRQFDLTSNYVEGNLFEVTA